MGLSKRLVDDFIRPTLLVGLFKPPEEVRYMHVYVYVCLCVCVILYIQPCMYVCMHACMYVSVYVDDFIRPTLLVGLFKPPEEVRYMHVYVFYVCMCV